jgi:hypothetical protein
MNYTPLELINLFYNDNLSTGKTDNPIWQKINSLLTWDNILNKGYQADLCPLLYYILTKWKQSDIDPSFLRVPDDILDQLKKGYTWSLSRNILLLDELDRVLKAFDESGIEVIVLKGADLAQTVYPDIALRPMSDLDILILNKHIAISQRALAKIGYKDTYLGNPKHAKFQKRNGNNQPIVLELHEHLVSHQLILPLDLEDVWSKRSGYCMNVAHLINYLSYHFAMHRFDRLIWIFDIAMLCKFYKNKIDWREVYFTAKTWKLELIVSFVMSILNDLFPMIEEFVEYNIFKHEQRKFNISKRNFVDLQEKLYRNQNIKLNKHILRLLLLPTIKDKLDYSWKKSNIVMNKVH